MHGENLIIVDDIITTGATINECINTLVSFGAGEIYVVALAVNQQGIPYWSSNEIFVSCPKCGGKMRLLINSSNMKFFYSCYDCHKNMSFAEGCKMLADSVNNEDT